MINNLYENLICCRQQSIEIKVYVNGKGNKFKSYDRNSMKLHAYLKNTYTYVCISKSVQLSVLNMIVYL